MIMPINIASAPALLFLLIYRSMKNLQSSLTEATHEKRGFSIRLVRLFEIGTMSISIFYNKYKLNKTEKNVRIDSKINVFKILALA